MSKTRQTRQKEILNNELENTAGFFTAEELFEEAIKNDKKLGLATVYRFLKNLREKQQIFSYMCDGRLVYSRQKKSHCHFVCESTGKIIHFDVDSLDFLKDKIPGTIKSFQIEVKGLCDDCAVD